ncbi:UNVERIFIED_CONTAM: hypothetical protein FKN15_063721 [Acipenser sinensis]
MYDRAATDPLDLAPVRPVLKREAAPAPLSRVVVGPAGTLPLLMEVGATNSPPTEVEVASAGILPLLVEVGVTKSPPMTVEVAPAGILPVLAEVGATHSPPMEVEAEPAGILPLLVEVGATHSPPTAVEVEPAGPLLLLADTWVVDIRPFPSWAVDTPTPPSWAVDAPTPPSWAVDALTPPSWGVDIRAPPTQAQDVWAPPTQAQDVRAILYVTSLPLLVDPVNHLGQSLQGLYEPWISLGNGLLLDFWLQPDKVQEDIQGLSQPVSSEGGGGEEIGLRSEKRLRFGSGSHSAAGVESRAAGAPDLNPGMSDSGSGSLPGAAVPPCSEGEERRAESLLGAAVNPSLSDSQQAVAELKGEEQLKTSAVAVSDSDEEYEEGEMGV